MLLQDLEGHDKVAIVFDDNAHVWDQASANLFPIHPYCYWQSSRSADQYWVDEFLRKKAHVQTGLRSKLNMAPYAPLGMLH